MTPMLISKPCTCAETSYLRQRGLPLPAQHSCAYVAWRVALIPQAQREANLRYALLATEEKKEHSVSSVFMERMNELVAERMKEGLI